MYLGVSAGGTSARASNDTRSTAPLAATLTTASTCFDFGHLHRQLPGWLMTSHPGEGVARLNCLAMVIIAISATFVFFVSIILAVKCCYIMRAQQQCEAGRNEGAVGVDRGVGVRWAHGLVIHCTPNYYGERSPLPYFLPCPNAATSFLILSTIIFNSSMILSTFL